MSEHEQDRQDNTADSEEQPDFWEGKTPWQKYKARKKLTSIILSDPAPLPFKSELWLISDMCKSFFQSRKPPE